MRFPLFAALVCRISRQKKTAKIWVSFLSPAFFPKTCVLPFFCEVLSALSWLVARAFFCLFWVKKRRLFLRFSLLASCLRVLRWDLPRRVLGCWVLTAQPVRGMLGMPGMLGMLMLGLHTLFEEPVSRCSFGLIRAVSWRVHGSFFRVSNGCKKTAKF